MRPLLALAIILLPVILAACSQEAAPPAATNAVERPTAPGPAAPLPTPARSPLAAPTDTIPPAFHGEWNRLVADCGTGRNDSQLWIAGKQLRFHESSGAVQSVREKGRAITVRARYTGEGETWEAERRFTLSSDGRILSADGMERTRCPSR
jgi:hypothetical protein